MASVLMTRKESIVDQLEQAAPEFVLCLQCVWARSPPESPTSCGEMSTVMSLAAPPGRAATTVESAVLFAQLHSRLPHELTFSIQPIAEGAAPAVATPKQFVRAGGRCVHRCEVTAGQVFRSLPFPKAVDATKAKAEYQNGMLNITVPIAPDARAKQVGVTNRVDRSK
jgi:hypothetical protein